MNPMPEGTFTQTDHVRPWAELDDAEKAMFCRMAEVYAGFSEYTDAQVGRIVDYLEESGQLDNTLILYCADNGASGEGSPNGSVNEGKIFGGYPDDLEQNLSMVDKLGRPNTYNHYPTGWAMAFSTPYRMFKRYTYQGGVCDPLVIHWPAGIQAKGEVRHQYHHCTDIVPTILEACGVRVPDVFDGASRPRCRACRWRYSFDDGRRADREADPVLRDARQPRDLARGLEGRRRARADGAARGRFEDDTLAAVPHRRGPRRGARPRRPAPREARGAEGALDARRRRRTTCCRSTTCRSSATRRTSRRSSRWSSTSRCRRAASTRTTRARPRSRSAPRPTCTTSPTRCSPRSS